MIKEKRVFAFIDSQNLNLGTRKNVKRNERIIYKGWKLDFSKFKRYLEDKYNVSKSFLFIGKIPKNTTLYEKLENAGYTIVYKPTLTIHSQGRTRVKGNVDTELVLHAMIELHNYDEAIIVTGDGDFHCLIEYLEKKNKLKIVMIPNRFAYSRLFNKFYRYLRFVNEIRGKLEAG